MEEHSALLAASLAIMHPEMYQTGREAMIRLGNWVAGQKDPDLWDVFPLWSSVYNVVSVMANRLSPYHTDSNGQPQWLDLLVSVGCYNGLDFVVPTIRHRLRYEPGTVIALSGQMLEHGVGPVEGQRGVLSYYMRDNVHEYMDVPRCNYMQSAMWGGQ